MPSPANLAFLRFQATGQPEALAEVFDLTAAELLRIAAHLAPDAHAAEDIVQETFLAAIESRGTFTAGHDVGGWLLGILRHRAQRRWRAHSRDGDGHDARPGPRPRVADPVAADPVAEVQAIELTAEVDAAIQQLPATYRVALRLHLRHGLTPTEIALAHDRPAGSVRTLLARGLALLRARLPRGLAIGAVVLACAPRGLAALRETVVRAAAHAAVTPVSLGVATSALAITMKKVLLSVAAAAIVILAGAWQLGAFASPAPPLTVEPSVSLRAESPPSLVPAAASDAALSSPAPAREVVAAPPSTGRQYGTLRVRALWKDDGTPAPQVTVVLLAGTQPNPFLTSRAGVTGDDGTVRIDRVPAGEISVVTNDDARARVTVPADGEASVDAFEPRWGQVRGIVVDDAGAPVAGATVLRSDPLHYTRAHAVATTGADGRFAVPLGWSRRVGARKAGWLDSFMSIHVVKGETIDVILRLRGPASTVAGFVRDAHGAPVQHALVTAGGGAGGIVLPDGTEAMTVPAPVAITGPDGAFRLEGLAAGETWLRARAPDFGMAEERLQLVTGQTTEFVITLAAGAVVEGHVIDAGGRAIARAAVNVGYPGYFESNEATTASDGSFRLDSLRSDRPIQLRASKEIVGKASTRLNVVAGETTTWEARLVASPVLRGRVVDDAGRPAASALVIVESLDRLGRMGEATTAVDGSFAVECERVEPLHLCVLARRGAFPSVEIEEVSPGDEPITLTLPSATLSSARVRGVLVAPDGTAAAGAYVFLARGGHSSSTGFKLDLATGAFTVGPFPPGEYTAVVQARDAPNVALGTIRLEAGATHDTGRIIVGEAGSLKAQVVGEDGRPLPSGRLTVLTPTGEHMVDVRITAGAARVARIRPGDYLVRIQGDRSQDRAMQRVTVRADLETEVDLRPNVVPTRTVTVREIPHPVLDPIRKVEVDVFDAAGGLVDRAEQGRDGDTWLVHILTPPDGRGTLVVKGDGRERARLPLPAEGPIEVTLR